MCIYNHEGKCLNKNTGCIFVYFGVWSVTQVCHTCGYVGVEHSAILQSTSVPAAHSLALLWKVRLVTFLQH